MWMRCLLLLFVFTLGPLAQAQDIDIPYQKFVLDNGLTLINCFAGCSAIDVLNSLGLEWGALFPEKYDMRVAFGPRIPARDLLEIISEETTVVAIVAADMLEKRTVSEQDWTRLAQAAARIGAARDHVNGR